MNEREHTALAKELTAITPQLQKSAEFSNRIINTYSSELTLDSLMQHIRRIDVLGSIAFLDAKITSDMDLWIIVDEADITNVELVKRISDEEFGFRQELAKTLEMKNLDRHRASMFSGKESELYRSAFLARVEYPLQTGNHKVLYTAEQTLSPIPYSAEDYTLDVGISITEFISRIALFINQGKDELSIDKLAQRVARELHLYNNGQYLGITAQLRILVEQLFNGSRDRTLSEAKALSAEIFSRNSENRIKARNLMHSLMWTLEKVRWEILESLDDPIYLKGWIDGTQEGLGFSLPLLMSFLQQVNEFLESDLDLSALERDKKLLVSVQSPEALEKFHNTFSVWISRAMNLLTEKYCIAHV